MVLAPFARLTLIDRINVCLVDSTYEVSFCTVCDKFWPICPHIPSTSYKLVGYAAATQLIDELFEDWGG